MKFFKLSADKNYRFPSGKNYIIKTCYDFFFKYDFIIYNSILLHFWGKLFNKMKIHVI